MRPHSIKIGACILHPGTRCLERDGRQLQLEPKDYEVLVHLLDAAPDVVTSTAMMRFAWHNAIVSDNSLHQVIRRLRQALGDDARRPAYIKTVPKVGYRLIAPVVADDARVGSTVDSYGVVAVMPFREYSESGPQSYVTEGLLFELQAALSARGVQLMSWETMLEARRRELSEQDLQSLFGVDCVLDGSIVMRGGRIRLTAALNHVGSARQLWSGSYDLVGEDLLDAQTAVADQIANDLLNSPHVTQMRGLVAALKKPLDPCILSRTARHTSATAMMSC